MKKRNMVAIVVIMIALLILSVVGIYANSRGWFTLLKLEVLTGECRPKICNDFNFICCVKDLKVDVEWTTYDKPCIGCTSCSSTHNYVQCPTYAVECTIDQPIEIYTECHIASNWLGCPELYCSGKQIRTQEMRPGEWAMRTGIPSYSTSYFYINIYKRHLVDCGRAGCTVGVTVPGTVGCAFKTDKSIYDENGGVIKTPTPGQSIEYTVPYGECYLYTTGNLRRVCGDTCEECDIDSDCIAGHTYQYQEYGAEFQSGMLLLYGCKKYEQVCLEKNVLPDGTEECVGDYAISSRCEVVRTVPVECLPGSDTCGTNAFCDPTTFTCKSSGVVECNYDWECGTSMVCDWTTLTLRGKVCENNKCVSKEIQTVQCCLDVNCPSGWECRSDYKCYEAPAVKTECPYECCIDEPNYFDRPCAGDLNCVDNKCVSETDCIEKDGVLGIGEKCCDGLVAEGGFFGVGARCVEPHIQLWGIIIPLLAGALAFLVFGANAIRKKDYVGIGIAAIIGIMVGLAVWWIVGNWVLIVAGAFIALLLGAAGLYFIPTVILAIVVAGVAIWRAIRG